MIDCRPLLIRSIDHFDLVNKTGWEETYYPFVSFHMMNIFVLQARRMIKEELYNE